MLNRLDVPRHASALSDLNHVDLCEHLLVAALRNYRHALTGELQGRLKCWLELDETERAFFTSVARWAVREIGRPTLHRDVSGHVMHDGE